MALRVRLQYTEVLSEPTDKKIRVGLQYIEVLGDYTAPVYDVEASSDLGLSDEAIGDVDIDVSASSDLGLTDDATFLLEHNEAASSDLALTDEAVPFAIKSVSVASDLALVSDGYLNLTLMVNALNELTFEQTLDSNFHMVSLVSELNLTDEARVPVITSMTIEDILALLQDGTPNIKNLSASNEMPFVQDTVYQNNTDLNVLVASDLGLLQSATIANLPFRFYLPAGLFNATSGLPIPGAIPNFPEDLLTLAQAVVVSGPKRISVSNALGLLQGVDVRNAVQNISIATELGLSTRLNRILEAVVANALTLTDVGERRHFEASILDLLDVATANASKLALSTLAMDQALLINFIRNKSLTSVLDLQSNASYVSSRISLCGYDPQGALGTAPTLGTATLTLTYPFVSPTHTVVLRNPEFGNTDRLEFLRINRTSRGGELFIYSDPIWPKQQIQNVTVRTLKESQKAALQEFFLLSIGKEIGFLDHENRQWKGYIVNPDASFTHEGRNGYNVSIEFEGTLV